MQNEHRFALMLARLVDLLRQNAGGANERRAALHAIVDATKTRSSTVRLEEGTLSVEGIAAPQDVPFVKTLITQMATHDLAEIRFAHRAAPVDVAEIALALARPPSEQPIASVLRDGPVGTVQLVTKDEAERIWNRCKMAVTDEVLGGSGQAPTAASAPAPPPLIKNDHGDMPPDFVPAGDGAALRQMLELKEASSTTLASAVSRLRDVHDDQHALSKGLNAIAAGVVTAVRESRVPEAIDAMIGVIRLEAEEQREEIHLRYGVALRRVLQPEVLLPLIDYLLDPLYDKDVAEIMRRGGTRSAQLLLDRLVGATTFAERRAYMEALRQIEAGTEQVVGMLKHHEWFVVRNIADLVGEMRIEEGVTALGQAAKHDDDRVRLSAGLALAKIGTPAASKYLGGLLRDPDHRIRSEIAKQVKGRGLGALAMPLVNAAESEEDEGVRTEFYRALGRIGTQDAVQALIKTAKPKGFLKGFGQGLPGIKSDGARLAATEGLGLAGGRMSLDALEELSNDRDRGVRDAARRGLAELRARPDRGENTNTTMTISVEGAQKLETPSP